MPRPAVMYNRRKWQLIGKSQWCCSANCGHPLHALTYNWTRVMQLANTPPLQSTTRGLHPVSIHQMAPPVWGNTHPITAYYSVYWPRKDERMSRPGWLVTYRNKVPPPGVEPGHVTDPSTNRARRRVTSLIRPTPLPLRHAANRYATWYADNWSSTGLSNDFGSNQWINRILFILPPYGWIKWHTYLHTGSLHTNVIISCVSILNLSYKCQS